MNDSVKLRSWKKNDLENLVLYANNHKISRFLMDVFPHPYTKKDGEDFIARVTKSEPRQVLAIDLQSVAIGAIGIHPQDDVYSKNAELGYWLAEPFWGKGIMTNAIVQMVNYGFSAFEISRIYARPFEGNPASMRALEKAGFTLEARLAKTFYKEGKYLDEYIYAIRK